MRTRQNIFQEIDWVMVATFLVMIIFGWMSIYAATFDEAHRDFFDMSQNHGKQAMWMGFAIIIATAILLLDHRFFETFGYIIYGFAMLLLVAVLFLGSEIKGAQSWFVIGSFSFQPSEIAKYGTALALSKYLSDNALKFDKLQTKIVSFAIILAPAVLITLQPDVGSTLVFAALTIVLYRQGLSPLFFNLGFAAIVLFVLALYLKQVNIEVSENWIIQGSTFFLIGLSLIALLVYINLRKKRGSAFVIGSTYAALVGYYFSVDYVFDNLLKLHHQNRINELLGIVSDPLGAGYNVHQSMIAIGSGGFSGKGFLQGTQTKFHFVPEQSTDFIFCTVGEEWGFLGSFILVSLFVFLMGRIIWVAEKQRSDFTRLYGYSLASILFIHFFINIGMTIGLAPVIGIPLPFFSYGGSSLWSFTILLFTFIKLDSERKFVLR
jgi:rod shape determining protein RodA